MEIKKAIKILAQSVPNPSVGLSQELFYYISSVTPLVNVDLLIQDENKRTLLSWRNDQYVGKGWHVPGGIVRFKETLETRVKEVIETEIGAKVQFDKTPIALNQLIHSERRIRGHFISVLYKCFLPKTFIPLNQGLMLDNNGYLMWHNFCPDSLLPCQEIYRQYMN